MTREGPSRFAARRAGRHILLGGQVAVARRGAGSETVRELSQEFPGVLVEVTGTAEQRGAHLTGPADQFLVIGHDAASFRDLRGGLADRGGHLRMLIRGRAAEHLDQRGDVLRVTGAYPGAHGAGYGDVRLTVARVTGADGPDGDPVRDADDRAGYLGADCRAAVEIVKVAASGRRVMVGSAPRRARISAAVGAGGPGCVVHDAPPSAISALASSYHPTGTSTAAGLS